MRAQVVVGAERSKRRHASDRNARKLDLDYETYFFKYGCYENGMYQIRSLMFLEK